jgi:hypothetical protein
MAMGSGARGERAGTESSADAHDRRALVDRRFKSWLMPIDNSRNAVAGVPAAISVAQLAQPGTTGESSGLSGIGGMIIKPVSCTRASSATATVSRERLGARLGFSCAKST